MEHQKSDYFVADEPIEFLLLAAALSGVTIFAGAAMIIAALF
ncbi:hypothetical protein [Rhizobium sp. 16-449-1b]|nr:hypothetical protein [Rhizobium sp. 16-449-1b]